MTKEEQIKKLNTAMAEFLQLNQYQQRKLDALNTMLGASLEITPPNIAYRFYEQQLERFLSTDQYRKYYYNKSKFKI